MLFSIVIPVYNVERYLEECLQSIIVQVKNIEDQCEILLIDDGSTDSSGEICDRYQSENPDYVKVFHNVNQGLLLTRRFGYKYAKGEYIVNCDSDDMIENDMLEILRKTIVTYERPDMIIFNYYLYDGNKKRIAFKDILSDKPISKVVRHNILREFLLSYSLVSMCGAVYKRTCIDIDKDYSKFVHISNGEDSLQKIELFERARTYVYLNKALYSYRIGTGMTMRFDPDYYYSFKTVIEQIISKKNQWRLSGFDRLVAVKVLFTAGRAITQSRYDRVMPFREHILYLRRIGDDEMFKKYVSYLDDIKGYLQKDHYVLLTLQKRHLYVLIVILLRIKNVTDYFRKKHMRS